VYFAGYIGEPTAGVAVSELLVIEAHEREQCGMQVVML
jgi:hypothetical protein